MVALELYLTENLRPRQDDVYLPALSQKHPSWSQRVRTRISELRRLPDGWDGANGKPVTKQVAVFAEVLLEAVGDVRAPQIVPMCDGGLQIEWHANGLSIEISILNPPMAELVIDYLDGDEMVEREIRGVDDQLLDALAAISA